MITRLAVHRRKLSLVLFVLLTRFASPPAWAAEDETYSKDAETAAKYMELAGKAYKATKDPMAAADLVIGATALAAGPYGVAIAAAWGLIKMLLGPLGPDPFERIAKQLDRHEKLIQVLFAADTRILKEVAANANRSRHALLGQLRSRLREVINALSDEAVSDRQRMRDFASRVAAIADDYIAHGFVGGEEALGWSVWMRSYLGSDRQSIVEQLRVDPAVEAYMLTLAAWIRALEAGYQGDLPALQKKWGEALERHTQAIAARSKYDQRRPGSSRLEPESLAEQIMDRVTCTVTSESQWNEGEKRRECRDGPTSCTDRLFGMVPLNFDGPAATLTEWYPAGAARFDEDCRQKYWSKPYFEYAVEAVHGADIAGFYGRGLKRLKETGTAREPWVPTPSRKLPAKKTVEAHNLVYAVTPAGELRWHEHRIGPETTENMKLRADLLPSVGKGGGRSLDPTRGVGVRVTGRSTSLNSVDKGVKLEQPLDPGDVHHYWKGPEPVGTQWQKFTAVLPAGDSVFYGLEPDGTLRWFRHDGSPDGKGQWKGPIKVGSGWHHFARVFSGGQGVLYGIRPNGTLEWIKHQAYRDGTGGILAIAGLEQQIEKGPGLFDTPGATGTATKLNAQLSGSVKVAAPSAWLGPKKVAAGFGDFEHVFSAGQGVIYTVDRDGRVHWRLHKAWVSGEDKPWRGPTFVQNGWKDLRSIFASGKGDIYAVRKTGELVWTRHQEFLTGGAAATWFEPLVTAIDWSGFARVFANLNLPPLDGPR